MTAARVRVVGLLALTGVLRVGICPLCGALVVAAGQQRHAAVHTADARRRDDDGPKP